MARPLKRQKPRQWQSGLLWDGEVCSYLLVGPRPICTSFSSLWSSGCGRLPVIDADAAAARTGRPAGAGVPTCRRLSDRSAFAVLDCVLSSVGGARVRSRAAVAVSLPEPAVIESFPLPPVTLLLPFPALMTSLPSPPSIVSLPEAVVIVSFPAPPRTLSSARPPRAPLLDPQVARELGVAQSSTVVLCSRQSGRSPEATCPHKEGGRFFVALASGHGGAQLPPQ